MPVDRIKDEENKHKQTIKPTNTTDAQQATLPQNSITRWTSGAGERQHISRESM